MSAIARISEEDDLESNSSQDIEVQKVVLACFNQGQKTGISYWDTRTCKLWYTHCSSDEERYRSLAMIFEQLSISLVLIPSRSDDRLYEELEAHIKIKTKDGERPEILIRPNREFSSIIGKQILETRLKYGNNIERESMEPEEETEPAESSRMQNLLEDEKAKLYLSCIGAISIFIQRTRLLESEGQFHISSIESLSLDEIMQVNNETLSSLQIFSGEPHSNLYSDKNQEGLSIFGILNSTDTAHGKTRLKNWLCQPSMDINVIKNRQDTINTLLNPSNHGSISSIQDNLRIRNILTVLRTIRHGRGTYKDWSALLKFLQKALGLKSCLLHMENTENNLILNQLVEKIDEEDFLDKIEAISKTIDWKESANEQKIHICDGIDEQLDDYRYQLSSLPSMLDQVAKDICENIPSDFTQVLNVVYYPQLGYLMSIPLQPTWQNPQDHSLEGWDFIFHTESYCYYKDARMKDLDNHVGDLRNYVSDRELEILEELYLKVFSNESILIEVHDLMVDLDCLLAFSKASKQFDWVCPNITEENIIRIQGARHPLVELCTNTFIKNDFSLAGGQGELSKDDGDIQEGQLDPDASVMILTGANSSGKSVYIKSIGIIVLLAHVGCFVPADETVIGITDKLFTRINTTESVSKTSSAFMIDLEQVSEMLSEATCRSLLLIDEFGKGTDSADGTALFCGVTKELLGRGADCPMAILTTHFHAIFANNLLPVNDLPIAIAHMELIVDENDITYLYRLRAGQCLESHACICAKHMGIPEKITNRAEKIAGMVLKNDMLELINGIIDHDEANELKSAEQIVRSFIEWDLDSNNDNDGNGEGDEQDVLSMLRKITNVNCIQEEEDSG